VADLRTTCNGCAGTRDLTIMISNVGVVKEVDALKWHDDIEMIAQVQLAGPIHAS